MPDGGWLKSRAAGHATLLKELGCRGTLRCHMAPFACFSLAPLCAPAVSQESSGALAGQAAGLDAFRLITHAVGSRRLAVVAERGPKLMPQIGRRPANAVRPDINHPGGDARKAPPFAREALDLRVREVPQEGNQGGLERVACLTVS